MKNINNIDLVLNICKENGVEIKDKLFYRFWSKVSIKDNIKECWNWEAYIHLTGYGYFSDVDNIGTVLVHRIAYILTKGKIQEGLQVQHQCNNRSCCNPNHLELGDNSKNIKYMYECGRGSDLKGENNGWAKLTDDKVRKIHNLFIKGRIQEYKQWRITEPIAKKFGVSNSTIKQIINGKRWKHIYEEFHNK